MNTKFEIKKITEIVKYLLSRNEGVMNYTKLIKLLYLADKESLRVNDVSVSGDAFYSMKNGPILSGVKDLIDNKYSFVADQDTWVKSFEKRGYDLILVDKEKSNYEELSDFEIELLDKIDNEFKDKDYGYMIEYTHDKQKFPEVQWQEAEKLGTSIPISIESVLKSLNKTDEEITGIIAEVDSLKKEHNKLKS